MVMLQQRLVAATSLRQVRAVLVQVSWLVVLAGRCKSSLLIQAQMAVRTLGRAVASRSPAVTHWVQALVEPFRLSQGIQLVVLVAT
jgi:hypothetical protein